MTGWEYRVETVKGDTYLVLNEGKKEATFVPLNELGKQGWELVNVVQIQEQDLPLGYFKKEIKKDKYEIKPGAKLGLDTNLKIDPSTYLKQINKKL